MTFLEEIAAKVEVMDVLPIVGPQLVSDVVRDTVWYWTATSAATTALTTNAVLTNVVWDIETGGTW